MMVSYNVALLEHVFCNLAGVHVGLAGHLVSACHEWMFIKSIILRYAQLLQSTTFTTTHGHSRMV